MAEHDEDTEQVSDKSDVEDSTDEEVTVEDLQADIDTLRAILSHFDPEFDYDQALDEHVTYKRDGTPVYNPPATETQNQDQAPPKKAPVRKRVNTGKAGTKAPVANDIDSLNNIKDPAERRKARQSLIDSGEATFKFG